MAVRHISRQEFIERIWDFGTTPEKWTFRGTRPAVIDFHAVWCGPCQALGPRLEELSGQYAGKVDFYAVDVDREEELASLFRIRTVPTVLFCPVDARPKVSHGALPKQDLERIIRENLLH